VGHLKGELVRAARLIEDMKRQQDEMEEKMRRKNAREEEEESQSKTKPRSRSQSVRLT